MRKLDANSGFWQIPLGNESRELTTFIMPFGCYCLTFGISSTPEYFQKRMSTILDGHVASVLCLMDNLLIFGKDQMIDWLQP